MCGFTGDVLQHSASERRITELSMCLPLRSTLAEPEELAGKVGRSCGGDDEKETSEVELRAPSVKIDGNDGVLPTVANEPSICLQRAWIHMILCSELAGLHGHASRVHMLTWIVATSICEQSMSRSPNV